MAIGSINNGDSGSSCRNKINQGLSLWDGLVGAILPYGGSSAPSKWALCNGAAVSRLTYSALFGIIGESFGSGDGLTTFNLPDFRGRVAVGVDEVSFAQIGTQIGSETHTLTTEQIPSHSHNIYTAYSTYAGSGAEVEVLTPSYSVDQTSAEGQGYEHNNIQPSLCVNYIIYTGV